METITQYRAESGTIYENAADAHRDDLRGLLLGASLHPTDVAVIRTVTDIVSSVDVSALAVIVMALNSAVMSEHTPEPELSVALPPVTVRNELNAQGDIRPEYRLPSVHRYEAAPRTLGDDAI